MTIHDPLEVQLGSQTHQSMSEMGSFEEAREDGQQSTRGPGKGRMLFCRKCEGHGKQSVLKGHGPTCPYRFCKCSSCQRLDQKRMNSFNKRNKERLEMARELSMRKEQERDSEPEIEVLGISSSSHLKAISNITPSDPIHRTAVSTSPASSSGGTSTEETIATNNLSMSVASTSLVQSTFAETSELKTSQMNAAMSYPNNWSNQKGKDMTPPSVEAIRHQLSLPPFINLIPNVAASTANSTPTTNSNVSSPLGQKRGADDVITLDDDATTKKRPNLPGYQTIPMEAIPSTSGNSINTSTPNTTVNGSPIKPAQNGGIQSAVTSPVSPSRTLEGHRYVTLPTIPPISILVPNEVKPVEKEPEQQHHSAPASVDVHHQNGPAAAAITNINALKASSASNLPRMLAPFPSIPTTSTTVATQMLPMFPIPATAVQNPAVQASTHATVQHQQPQLIQQAQLPASFNFMAAVSQQQATSIPANSAQSTDAQSQGMSAQLLQLMQQHILHQQQQQQAQQQQAQAHQQRQAQPMSIQSSQATIGQGSMLLAGSGQQGQQNGGLQQGNNGQQQQQPQATLVTPQMLQSMGINMAQLATLTPAGIQPIAGGLVNLNQIPGLALATSQAAQANANPQQPILLSSLASHQPAAQPVQVQQPQMPQQAQPQLVNPQQVNQNQPMQLVVPSMALIEQLQQQRLLQQQHQQTGGVSMVPSASGVTVPTTVPTPQMSQMLQQAQNQPQQLIGGMLLQKPSVQMDQNQLAQLYNQLQAQNQQNQAQNIGQNQVNPTLASMQAQLQNQIQSSQANQQNKIQLSQYMNQIHSLAMLGQGGGPMMK